MPTFRLREAHDFGILWRQRGSLTSIRNKIKNESYVQELLDAILLPAIVAIIKIQGILNVTLWKLKEITLLTFPQGMHPLKEPTAAKPLS